MCSSRFQEGVTDEKPPGEGVTDEKPPGERVDVANPGEETESDFELVAPSESETPFISPGAPSEPPPPPPPPPASPPLEPPTSEQVDEPPQSPPLVTVTPTRFWILSSGLFIAFFMATSSALIAVTSLKAIADEFKCLVSVTWVLLAYVLAECCFGYFFSRVSDISGRRSVLVGCLLIFILGSIAAGFAEKLIHLVAARAIQGIGGGGLFSVSIVSLQEVCPDHLLRHMAGTAVAVFSLACITSPILGAVLTQFVSWQLTCWIFLPLSIASGIIILLSWPEQEQRARNRRTDWKDFDYLGSVLLIAVLFLFVFSFQNVGVSISANAWSEPFFVVPLTIGIILLPIAVTWLYFLDHKMSYPLRHVNPALKFSLLDNRIFASTAASALCLGFPLLLLVLFAPTRSQIVARKTPVTAAITLLPLFGAAIVGGLVTFYVNLRHHWIYPTTLAGPCFVIAACRLLSNVSGAHDEIKFMAYLAVAGLGFGISLTSNCLTIGVQVKPNDYVAAFNLITQVRLFTGSLSIAAFSILLHNQILALLPPPFTADLISSVSKSKSAIPFDISFFMAFGVDAAFKSAMDVCTAFAVLAMLAALFGCTGLHASDDDMNFFKLRRLPIRRPEHRRRKMVVSWAKSVWPFRRGEQVSDAV